MKEVITLISAFGREKIEINEFNEMPTAELAFTEKAHRLMESRKFGFVALHSTDLGIIQELKIS